MFGQRVKSRADRLRQILVMCWAADHDQVCILQIGDGELVERHRARFSRTGQYPGDFLGDFFRVPKL